MDCGKLFQRQASPGRAYQVAKDKLALTDPSGIRLGVDENACCASFVITSDDPDRVGDVVTASRIILANFRKNPIGLYSHDATLPLGVWEDPEGNCTIRLEARRAVGTLYFSRRNPFARQVFDLVAEGVLRACSLGFNLLEPPERRDESEPNPQALEYGYRFGAIDLLEVSIVAIPAQPTATLLRSYLSAGKIRGVPICEPLLKSLAPLAEAKPCWSSGAHIDKDKPMSKKWKKRPPVAAAAEPETAKALTEGSGSAGGYLVGEDKATDDCVSEKIPKLIDEGYPQDQAVAIAFSYCEGKNYSVLAAGDFGEDRMILLSRDEKASKAADEPQRR